MPANKLTGKSAEIETFLNRFDVTLAGPFFFIARKS